MNRQTHPTEDIRQFGCHRKEYDVVPVDEHLAELEHHIAGADEFLEEHDNSLNEGIHSCHQFFPLYIFFQIDCMH